jgi:hypothetical protein
VGATIAAATGDVVVTFDRILQPGATAQANWFVVANIGTGVKTQGVTGPGVILGATVTLPTLEGGIAFPPPGVTYKAVPADVVSRFGLPAAPFDDFPIAVI